VFTDLDTFIKEGGLLDNLRAEADVEIDGLNGHDLGAGSS
jgi:hypothetical protein